MKEIWRKRKIAILAAVYVLLAFPAAAWGAYRLIGWIRNLSDDMQASAIDERIEHGKIAKLDSMRALVAKIDGNGETMDSIIQESQEVEFIEGLEKLASESGVGIRITADDSQAGDAAKAKKAKAKTADKTIVESLSHKKSIAITVETTGDYGRTVDFLCRLENGRYWANVVSLDLRKKDGDAESSSQSGSGSVFFAAPAESGNSEKASDQAESRKESLTATLGVIVYLDD